MSERSEPKKRKKSKAKTRRRKKQAPTVPPADCEVWPQQYRGENFKSVYGVLFAGKCQLCAYSCALPGSRRLLDKWQGNSRKLLCTNHPDSPGLLREVLPIDTCRNFKMKFWQTPARRRKEPAAPPFDESDPSIRRIPLGAACLPSSMPRATNGSASTSGTRTVAAGRSMPLAPRRGGWSLCTA